MSFLVVDLCYVANVLWDNSYFFIISWIFGVSWIVYLLWNFNGTEQSLAFSISFVKLSTCISIWAVLLMVEISNVSSLILKNIILRYFIQSASLNEGCSICSFVEIVSLINIFVVTALWSEFASGSQLMSDTLCRPLVIIKSIVDGNLFGQLVYVLVFVDVILIYLICRIHCRVRYQRDWHDCNSRNGGES